MPLPPRLRWKIERYRRKFREHVDKARDTAAATTAKQKVCPACRALVDERDSNCPFCNQRLTALDTVGFRRLTGGVLSDMPAYTTILLGANFVVFALEIMATQAWTGGGLSSILGGFPGRVLVALGARDYEVGFGYHQYWRLITAIFLHGGLLHLLFNCAVLYDVGQSAEELYGRHRFLVLYLFAGICASVASFLFHPMTVMVGCSGALMGLIGVMITYGYRHRTALGQAVKSMYIRWAIFGLIFGMLPGIDNMAHLGGLAGGIIFGMLVGDSPLFSRPSIIGWRIASYLCLALIVISFVFVALLYPLYMNPPRS